MNKSSLSLPFEQSPTSPQSLTANAAVNNSSGTHVKVSLPERSQSDRRKLSVTNIMSFGERRRSTSSIFSDMRKMSITNFDNLKSPGVGEIIFPTHTHTHNPFPLKLLMFSCISFYRFPINSDAGDSIENEAFIENDKVCRMLGS